MATVHAVGAQLLLQGDDAVDDRGGLEVVLGVGALAEEERGRPPRPEELLQGQDLATIADRVPAQQADLGQAVEGDAGRLAPLHRLGDLAGRRGELDIAGVEDRVLALGGEVLVAGEDLQDLQVAQVPAVRGRAGPQLRLRLVQRDVEGRLPPPDPFQEELEGEGRLAGAGPALEQVDLAGQEPSVEDLIQSPDPVDSAQS